MHRHEERTPEIFAERDGDPWRGYGAHAGRPRQLRQRVAIGSAESVMIEEDALTILEFLIKRQDEARAAGDIDQVSEDAHGGDIQGATDLPPARINDAVALLRQNGFVDGYDFMGTRPFDFGEVHATPFGRFEYQRALAASVTESGRDANGTTARARLDRLPVPIGSPYGFTAGLGVPVPSAIER